MHFQINENFLSPLSLTHFQINENFPKSPCTYTIMTLRWKHIRLWRLRKIFIQLEMRHAQGTQKNHLAGNVSGSGGLRKFFLQLETCQAQGIQKFFHLPGNASGHHRLSIKLRAFSVDQQQINLFCKINSAKASATFIELLL